jgi:signal transduction histidine kinase
LLADSLDLVGHHLRKAEVKAGLTCRMIPPLVYGEAPQLRQAFFNLLLNAGQQVGTGGRLQVVIDEAADMPGFLGLALFGSDASGAGHDFSRSFAFFFAAQSETETAGIGLYLTRRILDEAGARITFAEAGEQGVGLRIYLPVNAGSRA